MESKNQKEYRKARENVVSSARRYVQELTANLMEYLSSSSVERYVQMTETLVEIAKNDPGKLENILETIGLELFSVQAKTSRSTQKAEEKDYLTLNEAAGILRETEINNGLPEDQLATTRAYQQRVRYQIKQGRIKALKAGKIIKGVDARQFKKQISSMTYEPSKE